MLEAVWYDYWGGSARQIVRKAEGDPVWRRTWFQFDGPGRAWMTVQDNWELNTNGTIDEDTLSRSRCTEFRYGGSGRHRYLTRALNPETLQPTWCYDGRWSDYFAGGGSIYTDYSLSVGDAATNDTPDYVVTNDMTRHMPGAWQSDASTSGTWSTSFIHGDQIDSMRTMTAGGGGGGPGAGTIVQRRVYTAFGESVHESGSIYTRYGYAGAWGYGGGEPLWFTGPHPMTLLHVGERLYDPGIGRFLQRDSIGLAGGQNWYTYARNDPVALIDPAGKKDTPVHVRPVLRPDTPKPAPKPPAPLPPAPDHYPPITTDPVPPPLNYYHSCKALGILAGIGLPVAAAVDTVLVGIGVPWWIEESHPLHHNPYYCTKRMWQVVEHEAGGLGIGEGGH